jgi:hypothetical protein
MLLPLTSSSESRINGAEWYPENSHRYTNLIHRAAAGAVIKGSEREREKERKKEIERREREKERETAAVAAGCQLG